RRARPRGGGGGARPRSGGKPRVLSSPAGLQPPLMKPSDLLAPAAAPAEPVLVYTGPTRTGAALIAAVAADTDQQATARARSKKSRVASKKPDAVEKPKEAKSNAQPDSKGDAAKPEAKGDTKTAAKPG